MVRSIFKYACLTAICIYGEESISLRANSLDVYSNRHAACMKAAYHSYSPLIVAHIDEIRGKSNFYVILEASGEDGGGQTVKTIYRKHDGNYIADDIHLGEIKSKAIDESVALSFLNMINEGLYMADDAYLLMDGIDMSCYRLEYVNGKTRKNFYVLSGGDFGSLGQIARLEDRFYALWRGGAKGVGAL